LKITQLLHLSVCSND